MKQLFVILTYSMFASSSLSFNNKPYLYQVSHPVEHGEGPTWNERHQLLHFVDLHAGKILNYDPIEDTTKTFLQFNGDACIIVPTQSDSNLYIVAVNRTVLAVEVEDNAIKNQEPLITVANDKPTSRFNDGKADSKGRLWFGTMGYENASGVAPNDGSMYLITSDNIANPDIKISPVNVSNGLAWNKANDKFFYIDSPSRQIKAYNYDENTGSISNQKVLFDLKEHPELGGVPDGMTIDQDDNLWIALYGGGSVIKVNSTTGDLLQVIAIPAKYVTSVAWGGPNFETLYVTTSRFVLTDEEKLSQPAAGSLFAIENLNAKGLPAYEADIIDHVR